MKTLTIHSVKEEFFKLSFHNYKLTFDDGLFSQYFHWPIFRQIPTEKILFISTNLIGIDGLGRRKKWKGKYQEFPDCFEALEDFRKTGNRENYMRLEELQEIIDNDIEVIIGGHGHNHMMYYNIHDQMRKDMEDMLEWFDKHLHMKPIHYAFPHYEQPFALIKMLKEYGFQKLYGAWRIEIEEEINLLSNV
jgi:hypothetical protein